MALVAAACGDGGTGPDGGRQDVVLADPGVPVELIAYTSGDFQAAQVVRRSFTGALPVAFDPPGAYDELVAFTPGRAPLLVPVAWTAGADTVRLRFAAEPIRLPITIWVVQPPFDETARLVERHVEGMRDTWEAQGGIGLGDVRIVDATGDPDAAPFQGDGITPCNPAIVGAIGYEARRLNAYYVGQPAIGAAAYCGDGLVQVFPIAADRPDVVLAHEIGHGLLGGHHETLPDNVMHFRGEGSTFSAGQLFRAHYSDASILNTIFGAYPPRLRRSCDTNPASLRPGCPPTTFVLD